METVFPSEAELAGGIILSDEQVCRVTRESKVVLASGESDAESIRDQDSGPGRIRWSRRNPYFFRREPTWDSWAGEGGRAVQNYRRVMRFKVAAGDGEGKLWWEPVAESDPETGEVTQESFVLSLSLIHI